MVDNTTLFKIWTCHAILYDHDDAEMTGVKSDINIIEVENSSKLENSNDEKNLKDMNAAGVISKDKVDDKMIEGAKEILRNEKDVIDTIRNSWQ